MSESAKKDPTFLQSTIPIGILILLLSVSVLLFSDSSSSGPNQMALILAAMVAVLVGLKNGYRWEELQQSMVNGISLSMGAIFILLVVGSLIGTWIMSGIVPTMIYYGLLILNPAIFYFATCVVCAMVAIATGSSWSTAGTVGIALVGIAAALGLSVGITAGAIISGAYFGDKLSPLSDTTNLAPAMAGTDLFTHIRHMLWTTVPSFTLACILFLILGFTQKAAGGEADLTQVLEGLSQSFNIGWYLLLLPAAVIYMVMRKVPAFPALFIGALLGGVFAMIFQQDAVVNFVGDDTLSKPVALVKGFWMSLFSGYSSQTGNNLIDGLLSRGGMAGMLNTIWLIMSAMMFGAVMEKTKMLFVIAQSILGFAKSTGSLVFSTLLTAFGMNVIASDQYIAIVLPGRMFRAEFANRKLHPKNLSRCLEDSGTLTSALVPWNTCGAYMSTTLGVPVFAYLPFAFFNLFNPIISAIYGFTGFTIEPLEETGSDTESEVQPA